MSQLNKSYQIKDCDILTYSGNTFDVPLLNNEFGKVGLFWDLTKIRLIDAAVIYKRMRPRTLEACYAEMCGKSLDNAHSAEADALATIDCFESMIDKFPELPKDNLGDLELFCNYDKKRVDVAGKFYMNEQNEVCFNFGRSRGTRAKDDIGLLNWMLDPTRLFAPDTKEIAQRIIAEQTGHLF